MFGAFHTTCTVHESCEALAMTFLRLSVAVRCCVTLGVMCDTVQAIAREILAGVGGKTATRVRRRGLLELGSM